MQPSPEVEYLRHVEKIAKSQGSSLSAIAREAELSTTTLTRPVNSENHQYVVKRSTIEAVERVTGISFADFIGGAASPPAGMHENVAEFVTSVPIYDIAASAGVGMIVPDYEAVADNLAFPSGYLRHITSTSPKHLAIISVTGASMLPTLNHDDLVMVDTTKKNIAYDGMFVIRHEDLLKVKRLRWSRGKSSIIIRSDNVRDFPEEDADPIDIEIVGRVIWTGKKEA